MNKPNITIEKDISLDDEKRIKKNLKKIYSAIEDLNEMNYNLYLSADSLNICDGETHYGSCAFPDQSVVVASLAKGYLKIDSGDW